MKGKSRQLAILVLGMFFLTLGSYGAMGRIVGAPVAGLAFDINIYLPYLISGAISAVGAVSMFWSRKRMRRQ